MEDEGMSETTAACVRGCAIYRQHYADCEGTNPAGRECRGCLPRRATNGLLCDPCYRRLQLMLTDAPVVYRWLTGNLSTGTGSSRPHEDYERGGTPELPSPLKEHVLDLRDLFADQLTEWVDEWCEKHGLTGPERHDVAVDSRFLLTWLPGIVRLDWIGDWFEQVAETLIDAHTAAPWRPAVRRVPKVPCPGCGETNLVIYGGESDVTCQSCKMMMTEERFGIWEQVLKQEEAEAS